MNHQIVGQIHKNFRQQNASFCITHCCRIYLVFLHTVSHTNAWIIVIYRGVIFFRYLVFHSAVSPSHIAFILILALFSSIQLLKWNEVSRKIWLAHDAHRPTKEKNIHWMNFVVAFRCWIRKTKNFFMRRTRVFHFFLWDRFPSNYTYYFAFLLFSLFLLKMLLYVMINCTCASYQSVVVKY